MRVVASTWRKTTKALSRHPLPSLLMEALYSGQGTDSWFTLAVRIQISAAIFQL